MTITHKRQPLEFSYTLQGVTLTNVTEHKDLGVTIPADLRWSKHIDNIIGKANKRLGFIRRTLKLASQETNLYAYKLLVLPMLEYACEVRDPYVKKTAVKTGKCTATGIAFYLLPLPKTGFGFPTLRQSQFTVAPSPQKTKKAEAFYGIINNLILVNKHRFIDEDTSRITRNKHGRHVEERRFNKECFRYSFFLQTARDGNLLPESVVGARGRLEFASLIS